MATLLSQPSQLCFSSDVADIVFGSNATNGTLILDLICEGERINLLEETMYPAIDGKVVLCDLSSMVGLYAKKYLEVQLECSFTDDSGKVSISPVTILFSMADVGTSASDFLNSHFLTTLNGEKRTTMIREERLYAYGAAEVTIDVLLLMIATGKTVSKSRTVAASTTSGHVSQFDVSPDVVASMFDLVGCELLTYTVSAGQRSQTYLLDQQLDRMSPSPVLLFTNSFGCEEFIYCNGLHKKESKYNRETARFIAKLRNFSIVENREFTANTGYLNEAEADWADELFRAEEVCLWVDGHRGKNVVISDSKSEISNANDNMPSFEFVYSYAQRIHNVMQVAHAGRVFDNTFDSTFE